MNVVQLNAVCHGHLVVNDDLKIKLCGNFVKLRIFSLKFRKKIFCEAIHSLSKISKYHENL